MWTALKATIIALLSSKKAVTAIIGMICTIAMKLGFSVDNETVALVLTPLIALIIGQGVADHGKPAAEAKIKATSVLLLLVLMLTGCSFFKSEAKHAGSVTIDCTTGELAKLEALTPVILPQIIDDADWSIVASQLEGAGVRVGGCVLANLIDRYVSTIRMATPDGMSSANESLSRFRQSLGSDVKFKTNFGTR